MDMPPMPPEQVIERKLVECGLEREGLSINYSDLLQSIEIVIAPSAKAAVQHFSCIQAATAGEIVTFRQGELAKAYAEFTYELIRPSILESSRKTLAERGLLEDLPERQSYSDDAEFARALEVHCGFKPGSAIGFVGGMMTILPDTAPSGRMSGRKFEKFSCLFAVWTYLAAKDGKLKIGFIGNEAFSKPESK